MLNMQRIDSGEDFVELKTHTLEVNVDQEGRRTVRWPHELNQLNISQRSSKEAATSGLGSEGKKTVFFRLNNKIEPILHNPQPPANLNLIRAQSRCYDSY